MQNYFTTEEINIQKSLFKKGYFIFNIKEKKIITTDSENINKEYSTEEGEVDKANENDLNNYADQNDNIKLNEKDMKSKFDQSKNNKKNKYKKKEEDLSVNKTKNKDLENSDKTFISN